MGTIGLGLLFAASFTAYKQDLIDFIRHYSIFIKILSNLNNI